MCQMSVASPRGVSIWRVGLRASREKSRDRKACAMTVLLLVLLFVYFAAVSVPISVRLVRVDSRARRTTRATAAWRIDDGLFGDIQKLQPGSAQVAPTQQHHRSELKAQVQGGNREQAIALATRGKAGLAARQNRLCHRCAFARIAGKSQNGEDDRPPDFANSAVPGRQTTLACLKAAISVASKPNSASTSSVCSPTSGGRAAILVGVRDRVTGWPTRRM